MSTTILDITQKIAEFQEAQIKKALGSINSLGIVPLEKINTEGYTPNFVIGSAETQNSTCVNYLNLGACTPLVTQKDVIHEAVWEEYMGVFGISMERAWSFSFQKNPLLTAQEIQARLCTNIVFVLKPPSEKGIATPISGVQGAMIDYYYQKPVNIGIDHDGFSCVRGKTLDGTPKKNIPQLMEIKTYHIFSKEEIIAVLVPESLYEYHSKELSEYFQEKVLKVLNVVKPINRLPEMLRIMHSEHIPENTLSLPVPDYESVLESQIAKNHKQFSLHAVRLPTVFDFTPRYIHNLSNSHNLLKLLNADLLKENEDGSAWVLVHQTKCFDAQKNESFRKYSGILSSRFDNTFCREQLLKAKAKIQTTRFVTDENTPQKTALLKKGIESLSEVHAIQVEYDDLAKKLSNKGKGICSKTKVLLLSYPDKCKANVDPKVLEKIGQIAILKEKEEKNRQEAEKKALEEKREKAARVIQSFVRKCLEKKLLSQHDLALKHYKEAKASLQLAEKNLNQIQEKLKRRNIHS